MRTSTDAARRIAAREIDARRNVARQDLATAFAEIFTPRVRGRRQIVETERVYGGITVRIAGPELDATDLGVLLAVLTLAGRDVADVAPSAERGALVAQAVRMNAAAGYDSLAVRTTATEIARLLGRSGRDGSATGMVRASLGRLMMIVVEGQRGREWGATHLIHAATEAGGGIVVSLNYRATRAVIGTGQWAAIDMTRFAAATEVQRVLMHRLAAHCTGGWPMPVSLDTLAARCWTRPARDERRQKERIGLIRDALPDVLPTRVSASVGADGVVTFHRMCGDRTTRKKKT